MLVGLWVTTNCNLKCKYCYEGNDKKKKNMDIATAKQAIAYILSQYSKLKASKLIIQFHGGEPLLNLKIIKFVINELEEKLKENIHNLYFGITTNGLLLSKYIIEYMCQKMSYDFSISIDGNESSNDKNRVTLAGEGTYQKVIKNAIDALSIKPDIRLRMTYDTSNVEELANNIIHFIELGFKNIVSVPNYYDKKWSDESMEILLQQMLKVKFHYKDQELPDDLYISILNDDFFKKSLCSGGISSFHIMPNGDIYPCSYGTGNEEFYLGNVKNTPALDIEKVKVLQKISVLENTECIGCSNYQSCIGSRCKIVNKVMTDNYTTVMPAICAIENVKYKFLHF